MLWLVIPAFNEADNLTALLPRAVEGCLAVRPDFRILVVDDGSTDSTAGVVSKAQSAQPEILLHRQGRNFGKAAALQVGFELALDQGATVIVMMDADGQDDPDELGNLVRELERGPDLVTGARIERNDRFVKRRTSRLYNRATAIVTSTPGRDFNSGYKAMRADVARAVSPMLYGDLHRYLTVITHWLGFRVAEVPVKHHARMFGQSKYGVDRFWRGFVDLMTVRFLMSYENRPSHLFSAIGGLTFAAGVICLMYLVGVKLSGEGIGDRPLLLAGILMVMAGLQLVLFGLLAELTVHARNVDRRRP